MPFYSHAHPERSSHKIDRLVLNDSHRLRILAAGLDKAIFRLSNITLRDHVSEKGIVYRSMESNVGPLSNVLCVYLPREEPEALVLHLFCLVCASSYKICASYAYHFLQQLRAFTACTRAQVSPDSASEECARKALRFYCAS